jgi:hypothetical protein
MEKTKSLVKREGLSGLREDVNRLRKHEFFDYQNMQEARDLLEAFLHAVYNGELRQAEVQAREFARVIKHDYSLKAIHILKDRGVEAKPFCSHEVADKDYVSEFRVRSRDSDWLVTPLAESDERIPVEFMRNLTYLRKRNLRIDGVAIATPLENKSLKEIVKEESRKASSGIARVIALVMVDPDPVLLIKIGPFYIEAGRWL